MLSRLRPFPPGWDAVDVAQHVRAVVLRRHAEGYEGAHLWMRAWGDTKDALGKDWRAHYRNGAADNRVSGRPVGQTDTPAAQDEPSYDQTYDAPDQTIGWDVREAVAKLDARARYVVEQCSLAARPQAEVGRELGLSVETIKKILMRARKQLADLLGAYADG